MDAIQAEKERAMRKYRRLQKIGTLLRCLEAVAALLLLSWSSARLPAAARVSVDFLCRLAAVLLSPRFVFLLGNAIVLLLFFKSGQLSPPSSSSSSPTSSSTSSSFSAFAPAAGDLYEEFLESRGCRFSCALSPPQEEIVYEDKAVCVETRAHRRSRSERTERLRRAPPELRRAETEVTRRKRDKFPLATKEEEEEEDGEEFRRAVEAFIAKQTKFHREECMAATFSPPLICSAASPDQSVRQ